jgi:hypothetical protein
MKRTGRRRTAARRDTMVWTLKVKLVFGLYADGPWEATIEIASSATLSDLHVAIQGAVGFSDDHMYTFYVARTPRSRDRVDLDNENGSLDEMALAETFPLPKGRKLFYWFDFGDDWKFSIERTRAAPQLAKQGERYPRVAAVRGDVPNQHPSWD